MRKNSLTPEIQERICQALKAGNTRRAACGYGGVSKSVFYNWIARGEEPALTKAGEVRALDRIYVDFVDAVTRAEDECEVWHVANLKKQAEGDWRASIEWLKRRRRDEWSERIDSDVTTKGEKMTGFNVFIHRPKDGDAGNG